MLPIQPLDDLQLRLQRPSVEEGLAQEEALLDAVCQGERRFGLLAWPILFRSTGGTPVPQCEAVVNVALALRCEVGRSAAHLEWGYHRLGDPWCDWLASLGVADPNLGEAPGAYCDGRFNVRIGRRKLVGTAQRWRRVRGCRDMALLAHGAMQVRETPEALVGVVNAFQAALGDPQRFRPESHIALTQALPDLDLEVALPGLLERLAEAS